MSSDELHPSEAGQRDDLPEALETLIEIEELPVANSAEPLGAATSATATDPDGATLRRFLDGDEQAYVELYAKYEASTLFYCRRMVSSETVGDDAFQNLWIRVFQLRNRSEIVVRSFERLLFRSARNECLNLLRRETMRAGSSDALANIAAPERAEHGYQRNEIKSLVRQALARLPFSEREAFVLHEYSGYSYSEVGAMTGTTEQNAKTRAFRARNRLRKVIQGWLGLGEGDDPFYEI